MKRKKREARKRYLASVVHLPKRLPRPRVEIDRSKAWFVCWTDSRQERRAEQGLRAAGFATYLPMESYEVYRKGQRREVERLPVGRYLFVGLCPSGLHFGALRTIDGVASLLGVDGVPLRVPARLIQEYADRLTGEPVQARRAFLRGQHAKVIQGVFLGFSGPVEGIMDERLILLLNLLGRATPVEVDVADLEAA